MILQGKEKEEHQPIPICIQAGEHPKKTSQAEKNRRAEGRERRRTMFNRESENLRALIEACDAPL